MRGKNLKKENEIELGCTRLIVMQLQRDASQLKKQNEMKKRQGIREKE